VQGRGGDCQECGQDDNHGEYRQKLARIDEMSLAGILLDEGAGTQVDRAGRPDRFRPGSVLEPLRRIDTLGLLDGDAWPCQSADRTGRLTAPIPPEVPVPFIRSSAFAALLSFVAPGLGQLRVRSSDHRFGFGSRPSSEPVSKVGRPFAPC
jgi:hypothetical protein